MTIPRITKEQALVAFSGAAVPLTLLEIYNERIDAANAQQTYISAGEARKLGVGNVMVDYNLGEANEPKYQAVDRFKADECIRRGKIVEQLNPKECWHVVYRTPVQGMWEDGTVVKYRAIQSQPEPVEPHATLLAEYQKQVAEGTTGFYLWEASALPDKWTDIGIPDWSSNLQYRCIDISC